jgi:hypothetical protein
MLALVITIVGLLASLVALYEFYEQRRKRDLMKWSEADKLVLEVLDKLDRDKFDPDLILGVGRGARLWPQWSQPISRAEFLSLASIPN